MISENPHGSHDDDITVYEQKIVNNNFKKTVSSTFLKTVLTNFSDKVDSPIFVIRSYAQLLQKTQDKEILGRGLGRLDSASLKLENVVRSLFTLLNIYCQDTPKNDLVYFNEAFENIQLDLSKEIETRDVKFEVDFSAAPNIWFPVSYLKEIFRHLISNALIHNSKKEDLVISISTCKILNNAVLEIKDNGKGIDIVMLEEGLGKPFNNQSKDETNVGVGLSIIEAISKATESVYEIESTLEMGTICRFYFRQ